MAEQLRAKQRTQQEAFSVKDAKGVFANFLARLDSGEISPYKQRLDVRDRLAELKKLVAERGLRYAGATLENFHATQPEQKKAVAVISDYIEKMPEHLVSTNGGGLLLIGPPGTGKDHLLMAAMKSAIIEHGFTVVWVDGLRMFHRIKAAIASGSTEREIASYVKPQILSISDPLPPKDELSTYEMACLRDIIEQRYSAGKSVWITTNVQSQEEAKQKLTGPLLSRIGHNATEVNCTWPCYRKPLATKTT